MAPGWGCTFRRNKRLASWLDLEPQELQLQLQLQLGPLAGRVLRLAH